MGIIISDMCVNVFIMILTCPSIYSK